MSDEAFKDAKIQSLTNENQQLLMTVTQWGGELRARKQCCDELFNANIQLRTTYYLQDDQIKKMQQDNNSLINRVNALENEKGELLRQLAEIEEDKELVETPVEEPAAA